MEAGNGCGHNSTTSEIFTSFDANHSRYGGFFAEYYSALHEANVAISTHDPNADASAAAAAVARERAMAWVPQKDFNPAMLIPPDAILKLSQSIVSLGKEVGGLAAGIIIYREGNTNPGNLTPRTSDEGMLSLRDSLSNPWPLPSGQRPNFRPGESYFGIDTSLLPDGSVIYDNNPPGHVSVFDVSPSSLKNAVVVRGTFPK